MVNRLSCGNCKQTGHNKGTCKRQYVPPAPPRKKGRPRKCQDNDDPWSIHNAPKRRRIAQSQSTPPVSQSTQNHEVPQHSSAPPGIPSGRGHARGRPPGRGNGRNKAAGKGRGRGSAEAPKDPVFLMSPWTDKVFDVWQAKTN